MLDTSEYRASHGQEPDEHLDGNWRYRRSDMDLRLKWMGTIADLREYSETLTNGATLTLLP